MNALPGRDTHVMVTHISPVTMGAFVSNQRLQIGGAYQAPKKIIAVELLVKKGMGSCVYIRRCRPKLNQCIVKYRMLTMSKLLIYITIIRAAV